MSKDGFIINDELSDSFDEESSVKEKGKNVEDFGDLLSIDGDAVN